MLVIKYLEEVAELKEVEIELFRELCKRVGTTLSDPALDVGESKPFIWHYEKYSWTKEEESSFEKWAVSWMYEHPEVFGRNTKRYLRLYCVPMWMLNFSWKEKR